DEMLGIIVPMAEKVITVTPHSGRAENAEALRDRIIKIDTDCQPFDDYEEAFEQALAYCREDDLLLVCGSLYMIGDMRKIIKKSGQ
ncbi:MAG: bifunctional folylpolyglutamate synthase/dihydrofolate synthase, partial [Bacillota bacterium]|nr:bifunctional folylpolyglutamate synthase/dihydrofolate synthase [Bacillota bacterium]